MPRKHMVQAAEIALPKEATPEEVWTLGLRYFKRTLPRKMDPEYRLKVLTIALKWLSTSPVELSSKDQGELKKLLRDVNKAS